MFEAAKHCRHLKQVEHGSWILSSNLFVQFWFSLLHPLVFFNTGDGQARPLLACSKQVSRQLTPLFVFFYVTLWPACST